MTLEMDGEEHLAVGKPTTKSCKDEFIANSTYGHRLTYINNNVMNHLINILTNIIMKSNAK
jgi:hypothetical protein